MANYGYGYGTYTTQPQQYAAAASFGYAAYAPTAYATQPQVPVAATATYGYPATAGFVPAQKTTQSYGYGVTAAAPKTTSYTGTTYQKPNAYVAAASVNSFSGSSNLKSASNTAATSSHANAYEKVVYNAASSFLSEQSSSKSGVQKSTKPTFKLNGQGAGGSTTGGQTWYKNVGPPKVQQLHYCDVCKISCAGLQTYKEHLNGQKHKKKAAMTTTDTKKLPPGTYKCELCDVVCTGKDAYNAHVKGASHQRTLKLHQKLGKAIPEVKVLEKSEEEATGDSPADGEIIGESYVEDVKNEEGKVVAYNCTLCECKFSDVVAKTAHVKGRRHRLTYKKKVDPKIKIDFKGRDHRRDHRGGGGGGGGSGNEMAWRQREHEQMRWEQQLRFREEELRRWEHDEYMKRSREDKYWTKPDINRMNDLEQFEWERKERYSAEPLMKFARLGPPQPPQMPDDRVVMAKQKEIYPGEGELKQVHSLVASTEKALKLVSDALEEEKKDGEPTSSQTKDSPEPLMKPSPNRILKGVMRVGALAKGLLLKGQFSVELVVLCADKPTYTLLDKIGKLVPLKLNDVVADGKFDVVINVKECAIIITSKDEDPKCTVKVSLTSPAMREGDDEEKKTDDGKDDGINVSDDPPDVIDKDIALQALASLRHAKWFQARATHLASCIMIIRVMRDLCDRVVAFKPLSEWAIEVLCEKSLACSFQPLGPGDALRRVMEAISSGIFLPGGSGLLDPCEKEKSDAAANMSPQERENITSAAQLALRFQSFGQLHKVLGVEALKANSVGLKRRAEENGSNGSSSKLPRKE